MWCHLCKKKFADAVTFGEHIMKKHKLSSTSNEDDSDSEHSNQSETSNFEVDDNNEIEENSSDEDFFSDDNCSKNKSCVKAATPRMSARVKTKGCKISPRNIIKVKINPKPFASKSNLKTNSKSIVKNEIIFLHQLSKPRKAVPEFNPQNISAWLKKFKEMYKKFSLPLNKRLFNKIKTIHKEIFDHYCITQPNEVTSAVLKVYEELDWIIHRHISSMNETLN